MSGEALQMPARQRRAAPLRSRWVLVHGDVRMDLLTRALSVGGQAIELQPRQFDVLAYLVEYAGRFVGEDELLERMWRSHHNPRSSVVRVQISLLRKALGEHGDLIETGVNRCWRIQARPRGR
jgi:two-component system OmpR family response regulator